MGRWPTGEEARREHIEIFRWGRSARASPLRVARYYEISGTRKRSTLPERLGKFHHEGTALERARAKEWKWINSSEHGHYQGHHILTPSDFEHSGVCLRHQRRDLKNSSRMDTNGTSWAFLRSDVLADHVWGADTETMPDADMTALAIRLSD